MAFFSRNMDAADDFDEYDPTPYGGGYDIVLTYGRPFAASDETCYPTRSSSVSVHVDNGRRYRYFSSEPFTSGDETLKTDYKSYARPTHRPSLDPTLLSLSERPRPNYGSRYDNRPGEGILLGSEFERRMESELEDEYPRSNYQKRNIVFDVSTHDKFFPHVKHQAPMSCGECDDVREGNGEDDYEEGNGRLGRGCVFAAFGARVDRESVFGEGMMPANVTEYRNQRSRDDKAGVRIFQCGNGENHENAYRRDGLDYEISAVCFKEEVPCDSAMKYDNDDSDSDDESKDHCHK